MHTVNAISLIYRGRSDVVTKVVTKVEALLKKVLELLKRREVKLMALYPTERLKTFGKAKELRKKIYRDFVTANERGVLVVAGSGASHIAIPYGLGDNVFLSGESYGANVSVHSDFCLEALEAVEKAGYARDLCAYMRNYIGSVMLNKYVDAEGNVTEPFPKIDFFFTYHICDDHARWWRKVQELQGNTAPLFAYDQTPGYHLTGMVSQWGVEYLVEQLMEGIEWMEKVTGRTFDDEKFKEAFYQEARSGKYFAEAMLENQNIPAPLDERMIYAYMGLTSMRPCEKEIADFMKEFRDEVRDRAARGIAAVPNERYRVMTDSNPPWQGIKIFRNIEKEYGVVSIGSKYSFGLHSPWRIDEDGKMVTVPIPHESGVPMNTREELVRAHIDWKGNLMTGYDLFSVPADIDIHTRIMKQWKADAALIHLNRGCFGQVSQKQARIDLLQEGYPVCVYEGNVGDFREFDYERTMEKLDSFFDGVIGKEIVKK